MGRSNLDKVTRDPARKRADGSAGTAFAKSGGLPRAVTEAMARLQRECTEAAATARGDALGRVAAFKHDRLATLKAARDAVAKVGSLAREPTSPSSPTLFTLHANCQPPAVCLRRPMSR